MSFPCVLIGHHYEVVFDGKAMAISMCSRCGHTTRISSPPNVLGGKMAVLSEILALALVEADSADAVKLQIQEAIKILEAE